MEFSEPVGRSVTNSQIVVSENMATCSLNAFARSPIGQLKVNTDRLNRMLELFKDVPQFEMDTSTVGKFFPLFKDAGKEGKDGKKPMEVLLDLKDIDVKFGYYDTDVIFEYTACINFKVTGGKTLIYDELRVITSGSIKSEEDILYMRILSHKLDNNSKYAQTSMPAKDNIGVTENEYREFLSQFGFYMNKQKAFLNDKVLNNGNGIHLPMGTDEIKVNLTFKDKSMHIFLEIMKGAGEWLETEWWDAEFKR